MNLNEMRFHYEREEGYSQLNATARACQDWPGAILATSLSYRFQNLNAITLPKAPMYRTTK